MDEIYIYITELPDKMNEAVLPCCDGYTIYINEKLDAVRRQEAYEHAMHHIRNNDFEKENVQEIERDAHR